MAEIICLANSRKHGNLCIAGLDRASRRLIRPVSTLPDGGLTAEMQRVSGQTPCLLDILEVPLAGTGPDYGFQPENRLLVPGRWQRSGRAEPGDLAGFCEPGPVVLHNSAASVAWKFLHDLPRPQWKSLQLIRVDAVEFYHMPARWGGEKFRARFSCHGSPPYDLAVTDMAMETRIRNGSPPRCPCILLVSLGWPYPGDDPNPLCYKLVAGVIELPG